MDYEIIHLPKEQWKGQILPIGYTTMEYYDVEIVRSGDDFRASFTKKKLEEPITHAPEEYNYPDKLYKEHWEGAWAWGVLQDGKLVAAIETCPEEWANRLRVTELWVDNAFQKQGIGKTLMNLAKEQARRERRRAVILETQSCNANAIGFYLHEGFTLIGFDRCCYSNRDLERKEVRMELGYFPDRKPRLSREEVEIREEWQEEWHETESMVKRAFWNRYVPGCNEHYLVHKLRGSKDYLPEISRVAVKDRKIIGCIMYSKSRIVDGEKEREVVTFGPLCVDLEWQGCGVGEILVEETRKLAAAAGYPGIIILGEPDYYPRLGFKTCDKFGICTADGQNFDAFMGLELIPEEFRQIKGKFYEADVFSELDEAEGEEYDKQFEKLEKQRFPGQWK